MSVAQAGVTGSLDVSGLDPGRGRGPGWLDAFLTARLPSLIALRREIHAQPELSHSEHGTTLRLSRALDAAGISSRELSVGTGLIADLGTGPGGLLGLRADIDALPLVERSGLPFASTKPGIAHACGHDVHATVVLGAGLALAAAPIPVGPVRLLFQPAEEVMPGGAGDIISDGGMSGVERVFAVHCEPKVQAGEVGLRVGAITSTSDLIEVTLRGPGGHTSRPHLTADLVGAAGAVISGLPLQIARHLDPRSAPVMVWGAVHGGEAANAIPQQVTLRGTLRLMRREAWDSAEDVVRHAITTLVAPSGAEVEILYRRGVPPVDNEAYATSLLRAGALAALGPESVVESEQSTGAEDFAELLEYAPGALARLGVWDGVSPQVDLHSAAFVADERAIASGIRLLVHTVLSARNPTRTS